MNINRVLALASRPKKLADRIRPRLRNLNRSTRYTNADEKIRHLLDLGSLKLSWFEVFGEKPKESKLYLGMKNEIDCLNFDSSQSFGGQKSSFLAKKYTSGLSITDGFLLQFIHSSNVDYYLRQYFGGNYLTTGYNYWVTKENGDDRIGSQRWHTDPEDPIMLKLFVYFNKVNKNNGATEIISGTQVQGRSSLRSWHQKKLTGGYMEDTEIKRQIPNYQDLVFRADGEEGDILFLDTTALHRGGFGNKTRAMANITLTSTDCKLPFNWSK